MDLATWRGGRRLALFRLALPTQKEEEEEEEEVGGWVEKTEWFFCTYLSNGVGVDVERVGREKVEEALRV